MLTDSERKKNRICLGFGGPFPGLYYLITRWERIISPSGRSLSTDFTMFLTMSVALLSLRSNGPTDPLHISCICSIWKILHFYSSFSLNLSTSGFFHWVDTFSRIIKASKVLKDGEHFAHVNINEDLTKTRNTLAYRACQLKKKRFISQTWTVDGEKQS
jgi:hypothetical protein